MPTHYDDDPILEAAMASALDPERAKRRATERQRKLAEFVASGGSLDAPIDVKALALPSNQEAVIARATGSAQIQEALRDLPPRYVPPKPPEEIEPGVLAGTDMAMLQRQAAETGKRVEAAQAARYALFGAQPPEVSLARATERKRAEEAIRARGGRPEDYAVFQRAAPDARGPATRAAEWIRENVFGPLGAPERALLGDSELATAKHYFETGDPAALEALNVTPEMQEKFRQARAAVEVQGAAAHAAQVGAWGAIVPGFTAALEGIQREAALGSPEPHLTPEMGPRERAEEVERAARSEVAGHALMGGTILRGPLAALARKGGQAVKAEFAAAAGSSGREASPFSPPLPRSPIDVLRDLKAREPGDVSLGPADVLRGRGRRAAAEAKGLEAREAQARLARDYEAAEQERLNEAARAIRSEGEIRLSDEPKVRPPGAEVEIADQALREARAKVVEAQERGARAGMIPSAEAVLNPPKPREPLPPAPIDLTHLADHEVRALLSRESKAPPETQKAAWDEMGRRAAVRVEIQDERTRGRAPEPRSPTGAEQLIETRESPLPEQIASTIDSPKPPPTPSPVSPMLPTPPAPPVPPVPVAPPPLPVSEAPPAVRSPIDVLRGPAVRHTPPRKATKSSTYDPASVQSFDPKTGRYKLDIEAFLKLPPVEGTGLGGPPKPPAKPEAQAAPLLPIEALRGKRPAEVPAQPVEAPTPPVEVPAPAPAAPLSPIDLLAGKGKKGKKQTRTGKKAAAERLAFAESLVGGKVRNYFGETDEVLAVQALPPFGDIEYTVRGQDGLTRVHATPIKSKNVIEYGPKVPPPEMPAKSPIDLLAGKKPQESAAPPPGVGMMFFPGSPATRASAAVVEGFRGISRRIKDAFEKPEPYTSVLPPESKGPLDVLRGAREPKRIAEKVTGPIKRTVANVRDFVDAWNTLGKEPGIGVTKLSLQDDMKALVHLVDDVQRQKNKVVAAFDSTLRDTRDAELASTVLALRDLAQTVKENVDLPARQAEARLTIELFGDEARLKPEHRAALEEAREIVGYHERKLPEGFTPEVVAANLREAESALAQRTSAQQSVALFEQTMREAGETMREVYGINPREHYFSHFIIREAPESSGFRVPGLTPKARVPFSGAAQARVGSSKPFLVDAREVLSRHLTEVFRAKAIHEFVKKLQASPNNIVGQVMETGVIPEGYQLWSPTNAPTLHGMRASMLPVLRRIRTSIDQGIAEVLKNEGNPEAVREVMHVFQSGSMKPYMVLKEGVAKALDAFHERGPEATATSALVRAGMTLFKATVLVPSSGAAYLRRNAITDLIFGAIQTADARHVPGRLARGAWNLASFPVRRAAEVVTGKASPTLEYAREHGALSAGFFGSAGPKKPSGSFIRSILGQTAPPAPFRLLTPGGKVLRALEDVAFFAPRLGSELIRLLEAGPRAELIRYLEQKKGLSKMGATVRGNQAVVDYRVLSKDASSWREAMAPFIAWYIGTEYNFAAFPVREGSYLRRASSVVAKTAPFIAAYLTWNYGIMGEVEEALDDDTRARAHINAGFLKDDKGQFVLDPYGRPTPVAYDLGVDLPQMWQLGTAGGLWASSELAQDPQRKRQLTRLSDAFGRGVGESAKSLLGPYYAGVYTLQSGKTIFGDRPVESERTATLSDKERYDVAEQRYGVRAEPRLAAAAAPFVSPLRTLQRFENPDPEKAELAKSKFFYGDPRFHVEPGRKVASMRREYLTEKLREYADALESGDEAAIDAAWGWLEDMSVTPSEIQRFISTRERERLWRELPPEERRALFNIKYPSPVTTPAHKTVGPRVEGSVF